MKYFSIEAAQALIPKLTGLFLAAQETKSHIEKKVDDWRRTHKSNNTAEEAVLKGQVDFLATRLETQLNEIAELGCVPKDLDLGLVDFPARIGKSEGYFCWKMGEKDIQYWHGITEGYSGRKPLKREDSIK